MSQQTLEGQDNRSCVQQVWCRDTRHFYRDKNKTAEINLSRDIIKVCHNTIQEQAQRTGHDRKTRSYDRGSDKDWKLCRDRTFYVVTKRPISAIILGIHNVINEVRPNIGKPINTRF